MITGFDKETQPLSEYEKKIILPLLIERLKDKKGRNNAITNRKIVGSLKPDYFITETRVRKLINYIRTNDLIPALIATSDGYYIALTEAELQQYEESLKGREDAIRAVRLSIARQRENLNKQAL